MKRFHRVESEIPALSPFLVAGNPPGCTPNPARLDRDKSSQEGCDYAIVVQSESGLVCKTLVVNELQTPISTSQLFEPPHTRAEFSPH